MQCKERGDANSELFKEPHDEAVHKNSYKSRLCELISASLDNEKYELEKGSREWYSAAARFPLPACRDGGRHNSQRPKAAVFRTP